MTDAPPPEPTPDGVTVSSDPGEAGDPALRPPAESEPKFGSGDSNRDPTPAPSNHLTGGGDPAEGKR